MDIFAHYLYQLVRIYNYSMVLGLVHEGPFVFINMCIMIKHQAQLKPLKLK